MSKENITSEKAFQIFANVRHRDYYVTSEIAWEVFRWGKDEQYTFKELRDAAVERWHTSSERERHYRLWNNSPILRKEVYPGERDMSNQRAKMIEKLKNERRQK